MAQEFTAELVKRFVGEIASRLVKASAPGCCRNALRRSDFSVFRPVKQTSALGQVRRLRFFRFGQFFMRGFNWAVSED